MLSVTKDHYLTIVDQKGSAKQVSIVEALGDRSVFDWYGNVHKITVSKAKEAEVALLAATTNGESGVFGENHTVLVRAPNTGNWVRKPLKDITEPVYVQLPQRKVKPTRDLFDYLNIDDQGIYLEPGKATEMLSLMRKAAWCGILVSRRKSELRIDLDRRRPSCFAAKLINGSFEYDLEKTLSGLTGSGIVMPSRLFTTEYVEDVRTKGILMEGASVMNNVPLLPPRRLEKKADVYHITLYNESTPVELSWFHS